MSPYLDNTYRAESVWCSYFEALKSNKGLQLPGEGMEDKLQLISSTLALRPVLTTHHSSQTSWQKTMCAFLEQLTHTFEEPGCAKTTSKYHRSIFCWFLLLTTELQTKQLKAINVASLYTVASPSSSNWNDFQGLKKLVPLFPFHLPILFLLVTRH